MARGKQLATTQSIKLSLLADNETFRLPMADWSRNQQPINLIHRECHRRLARRTYRGSILVTSPLRGFIPG